MEAPRPDRSLTCPDRRSCVRGIYLLEARSSIGWLSPGGALGLTGLTFAVVLEYTRDPAEVSSGDAGTTCSMPLLI